MRTTETITTITCDLCGNKVEEFGAEEYRNAKIHILEYDVFWRGRQTAMDICAECNDKLINFMRENNMYVR